MKIVTMLELRQNSQAIIRDLKQGHEMMLTYRGKTVGKLMPLREETFDAAFQEQTGKQPDNFWTELLKLSRQSGPMDVSLTNEEIDRIVYDT